MVRIVCILYMDFNWMRWSMVYMETLACYAIADVRYRHKSTWGIKIC